MSILALIVALEFTPALGSPNAPLHAVFMASSSTSRNQDRNPSLTLLSRWRAGDEGALADLISANLDWLHSYARRKMGPQLRGVFDSDDIVQVALVSLMRDGPAFVPETELQFRALAARTVLNKLRDLSDHLTAERRDRRRESPIRDTAIVRLGSSRSPTRPDRRFVQNEEAGLVRLALELVSRDDKEVLVLRNWKGLSFGQIALELDVQEKAAVKRFQRAVARLGRVVRQLMSGRLDGLEAEVLAHFECGGGESSA